jgi:hypothetical protein
LAVTIILGLLVIFMIQLRKCDVTGKAIKALWFVLVANVIGSVTTKYITLQAGVDRGVYTYVFIEALIMMTVWGVYYFYKKPVPIKEMFGRRSVLAGLLIGVIAASAITSNLYAVYHIDNPAYVSAVRYLDAPIILLVSRVLGKPVQGRIWAGLGVVGCAACLIILKSGAWF